MITVISSINFSGNSFHFHCHCDSWRGGRRDTWTPGWGGSKVTGPPRRPPSSSQAFLFFAEIILKWQCSNKYTLRRHRHPLQISIKVVIRQRYKADMSEVVMEIKRQFFGGDANWSSREGVTHWKLAGSSCLQMSPDKSVRIAAPDKSQSNVCLPESGCEKPLLMRIHR